ncbi:MAG: HAD hydrolase-like protein [Mucilaginibacter sp.]
MSIKLVVFDIAGTTIQDEIGVMAAFRTTLKNHGYEVTMEEVAPLMGYKKIDAIRIMLENNEPDPAKVTPALIDAIHTDFVNHMVNFYQTSPSIEAFPHSEETFRTLHENNIKIGLNTGFTRAIADTILNRLQWQEKGLVDYLIASDEVENGRPHPYMIEKMMQEFGITDPQEVAKVGDTEVDVREGQNAGCKYVIGVTTGSFTRPELEPYHPTHIIDDIADVVAIVTQ